MSNTSRPLPTFAQILNAVAARVKAGQATAEDFGLARLMIRVVPSASRKARRDAGAALGSLHLLWEVACSGAASTRKLNA